MLAIVIPTILATLGVAFWFRSSNRRARYRPDFTYSGRLEMLVWSIPAMTVLLVGGVAWIGAHDLDPRKPIASDVEPLRVQVVSLDWKWLFIYPDQGIASVNQLTVPVGTPVSFELTSSGVMNSFFVPQLGSQIYTMAGMVTRLHLQADHDGHLSAACRPTTAATALPTCASPSTPCRPRRSRSGSTRARSAGPMLDAGSLCRARQAELGGRALHLSVGRSRPVQRHPGLRHASAWSMRGSPIRRHRGRKSESPGQAQLGRDPVRSADRHGRDGLHGPGDRGRPGLDHAQGILGPICGASGSPRSTTSASA